MISKGISVELKQAEKVRKYLYKANLLRDDLKIKRNKRFIYFPIKNVTSCLDSYNIITEEFEKVKSKIKSYKDIISIPDKLKDILPTSYDIIGNIIITKLKEELLDYKVEIGKALLKINKNIKTVCITKPVKGELRTRDLEIIAGEKSTKTIHKEYGLMFEVDISKTYFSSRLASERKRITDLVKPGEIVVDMFTGVAPFSIMIAKYAQPMIVYSIDKNQNAIEYAKKNIKKNNVLDKIEIIYSDAKQIHKLFEQKEIKANRIIMNLPFSSYSFFNNALRIMAKFCTIHYYDILKEEVIDSRINNLEKIAEKNEIFLTNFYIRKIKTYAPREFYIGIDITAKRNMPM